MSDLFCPCGQCVLCQAIAEQAAETRIMDAAVLREMVRRERERRHHLDPAWAQCICETMLGHVGSCGFCCDDSEEP